MPQQTHATGVQKLHVCGLGGWMTNAEREPITGPGAEPPAGFRGRAPGQEVRGARGPGSREAKSP